MRPPRRPALALGWTHPSSAMIRILLTFTAASALAAGASAQQPLSNAHLQPVANLQYGAYDFHHGFTVTPGGNRALGPDVLFDTTGNFSYYYGVVGSDTTKQEWLDDTWLPNRGLSGEEQITGMGWNYCEGGYTQYFDAYFSIYRDTFACAGPSAWVPARPSFAECVYGIGGLPGSGCWNVTIDLSGGFECVVPDSSNPQSGAQGTIGWSVTPFNCNNTPYLGPFIAKLADLSPGSQDLFEWRDWSGLYFGSYVYGGCFWFGGIPQVIGEFQVAFYGAAADVQNCYGSHSLDSLLLEAANAPENGATWNFNLSGVGGAGRFYLLVQPDLSGVDTCDQAATHGNGGLFTRQVAIPGTIPLSLGVQSADFSGSLAVPSRPVDLRVIFQVIGVPLAGPVSPAQVAAASNGLATSL